jgi:acetyl-CoA carboxylase alpha subunit
MGLIDEIVKEPAGGAHTDYDAYALVDAALVRHLDDSPVRHPPNASCALSEVP